MQQAEAVGFLQRGPRTDQNCRKELFLCKSTDDSRPRPIHNGNAFAEPLRRGSFAHYGTKRRSHLWRDAKSAEKFSKVVFKHDIRSGVLYGLNKACRGQKITLRAYLKVSSKIHSRFICFPHYD